ncbi:MAG: HDIG domain-containing protein [Clostridia bacterium]|nr:HDIG domain-containing protein [Clostridia bacterium]
MKGKQNHSLRSWFHSPSFRVLLTIIAAGIIICVCFFAVCTPKKYDLRVGSIAHETINATKDVIDTVATEEKKNTVAAAVEATYRFQEGVKENVLSSIASYFSQLRTIQQYGATLMDQEGRSDSSFTDEEIEYAQSLSRDLNLTRNQVVTLLRTKTDAFEDMVITVTTAVSNSLNTTIREGQVSQSIQTILQIVGYRVDISLTQNILPTLLRSCIQPNMIIDQEATSEARQKAMDAVEPVVYLQGQNIVREGDRITRSQLEMLRTLGLLQEATYHYSIYIGAGLLMTVALICLVFTLLLLSDSLMQDPRKMTVLLLILCICIALVTLVHLIPNVYLIPVALGPILAAVLLGHVAGISLVLPLGLLYAGMLTGNSVTSFQDAVIIFCSASVSGIAAIQFLRGHPQRIRVLLSGVISAISGMMVLFIFSLLISDESKNFSQMLAWTALGGLLSGVLAIALQPVFEATFHLATPSRLLEMTNPNQPLMRRLMIEAPGTYHHSIIVANLAEAAAQRIHANPYLARAGAYYHDIGKLQRPSYFKENQMGENPHEKTDPYISAAILISHTRDGMLIAQKEHFPPEVISIIVQHHGVTPVMYFYHKALQMSDGKPVDINDFRYSGPKPQTKEAAIVMLADTIEAAVRTMKDPTPKAINQFIERLVRGKLEDGQLSDCPLSLRDIDEICDAFSGILKGVYHERIEYPTVDRTRIAATGSVPAASPAPSQTATGKK